LSPSLRPLASHWEWHHYFLDSEDFRHHTTGTSGSPVFRQPDVGLFSFHKFMTNILSKSSLAYLW
jgi:hypothetical protein